MAEETKTTEKEKETNELMRCPCCGEMTLHKPLDIKSEILDEFMACILTGTNFSHTYTLYNKVRITVATPTKSYTSELYTALQIIDRARTLVDPDDTAVKVALGNLGKTINVYGTITEINTGSSVFHPSEVVSAILATIIDLQKDLANKETDAYQAAIEQLIEIQKDICSETKLSAMPEFSIQAVTRMHTDLYNILMETGFDENFWKGIELV